MKKIQMIAVVSLFFVMTLFMSACSSTTNTSQNIPNIVGHTAKSTAADTTDEQTIVYHFASALLRGDFKLAYSLTTDSLQHSKTDMTYDQFVTYVKHSELSTNPTSFVVLQAKPVFDMGTNFLVHYNTQKSGENYQYQVLDYDGLVNVITSQVPNGKYYYQGDSGWVLNNLPK